MTPRRRAWAVALLGTGLLLRAGYVVYARFTAPPPPGFIERLDPDSYYRISAGLLETGSLLHRGEPTTEREPGYPLLLAAAQLLLGRGPEAGLALNPVLGLAACWLLALAAARGFESPEAGLWTLGLACLYPEWVYFGGYLYRENLTILLLSLWAWLWAGPRPRPEPGRYAGMGAVWGLLCLTRSPMLPLGPLFAVLEARRLKARDWAATLGLFLAVGALVQAPWVWRNHRLTGRFVAGSSAGGAFMYLSLLKDYDRPDIPFEAALHGDDPVIAEVRRLGLDPVEAQPMFYKASWDIMVREPGRFWGAFWRKVLKLWRPYPHEGWSYGGHPFGLIQAAGLSANGSLYLLALLGLWSARGRRAALHFWLMLPAAMTAIYGLFWSVTRYHSPLMVGLLPLSALGARTAWDAARRRR